MENLYEINKIRTFTGKYINPLNPDPEMICIEDIAHALSMQCRFGGHTSRFYSVAEHSIEVANALPNKLKLAGLLHDAAEAYLLDIPKPVKAQIPGYSIFEKQLLKVILNKFGIALPLAEWINLVDRQQLEKEWNAWVVEDFPIPPLTPIEAKRIFLRDFEKYSK